MTSETPTISQAAMETPQQNNETDEISRFETLVGEGKRYRTQEDLAKARIHADNHIHTLEGENHDLRTQIKTLEQTLARFSSDDIEFESDNNVQAQSANDTAETKQLDLKDIEKTVESTLERRETQAKRSLTEADSLAKLESEFGSIDAGLDVVRSIVTKNPEMQGIIDNLGQTDSDAFLRLIRSYKPSNPGPNAPGLSETPSASAVRDYSKNFLPWSEAQKMRKEDPSRYNSPEIRELMEKSHVQAEQEGRDYFST